jgi:hypothetical protein
MTEEDEEFNRIEREATMKKRKYDDDDIQDYVRPWVGLTDEEQQELYDQWQDDGWGSFYKAIEKRLREKNT